MFLILLYLYLLSFLSKCANNARVPGRIYLSISSLGLIGRANNLRLAFVLLMFSTVKIEQVTLLITLLALSFCIFGD